MVSSRATESLGLETYGGLTGLQDCLEDISDRLVRSLRFFRNGTAEYMHNPREEAAKPPFQPLGRVGTKGCVQKSPIGKLNFNLRFGVRSAWRNTVTFALRCQSADWDTASAGGKGQSMEDETRMQRGKYLCCLVWWSGDYVSMFSCDVAEGTQTVIRLVAFDKAPAVSVDNLAGFSAVASQHVEATNRLT